MTHNWIELNEELPPEGIPVDTKIDDEKGVRLEGILIRKDNLFFADQDLSLYVYYRPTHWKERSP